MPNPLIGSLGASLGSSMAQSSAAKKASRAQAAASDAQIAESRRQFDLVRSLLQPYVDAGGTALTSQLNLLGLGGVVMGDLPTITTIAGGVTGRPDPSALGADGRGWNRGGRDGGRDGDRGALRAVQTPAGTKYQVNGQTFGTLEEAQAYAQVNRSRSFDPNLARTNQQRAIDDLANGAQFTSLVRQGEDAILANAAATGGLRGGDTQAALAQFRPQMLQALIDKQLANLGGIAANGQNAAGNVGSAAQNAGAQVNAALGDRGAALAGRYIAGGQATSNMFGDVSGMLGQFAGANGGIPAGAKLFGSWGF